MTGIASGGGGGQVGDDGPVADGHDAHPGVPVRVAVGAELFEEPDLLVDARLLGQLPDGCLVQVLVRFDESTRQCPPPQEGWPAPLDQQHAQIVVDDGEDHDVYRHGESRVVVGVVSGDQVVGLLRKRHGNSRRIKCS